MTITIYGIKNCDTMKKARNWLEGRDWIMGSDYTIADISMLGWVRNLVGFYGAGDLVDYDSLNNVPAWLERGLARPAVQRGLDIPRRPA